MTTHRRDSWTSEQCLLMGREHEKLDELAVSSRSGGQSQWWPIDGFLGVIALAIGQETSEIRLLVVKRRGRYVNNIQNNIDRKGRFIKESQADKETKAFTFTFRSLFHGAVHSKLLTYTSGSFKSCLPRYISIIKILKKIIFLDHLQQNDTASLG